MKLITNAQPRSFMLNKLGNTTYFAGMKKPVYMPQEATPELRAAIVRRTFAAGQAQGAIITEHTKQAYDRYINGELTIDQAIEAAMSIYRQPAVGA